MAQPLTGLRVRTKPGPMPLTGLRTRPVVPGDTSNSPLNEQGVTGAERAAVNNLGLGPESIVNWLQDQQRGYEAVHIGGDNYAVRKPGQPWRRLDPTGWRDWLQDLTTDAGDDYAKMAAGIKGATIGGASGLLGSGPVGSAIGAIAGAGIGTAGAEAARQAAARAAGFHQGAGATAVDIAREGAIGAAGEGASQIIGKAIGATGRAAQSAGRLLQRPEKLQGARDAIGEAYAAHKGIGAAIKEGREGLIPLDREVGAASRALDDAGAAKRAAVGKFRQTKLAADDGVRSATAQAEPVLEDLRRLQATKTTASAEKKAAQAEYEAIVRKRYEDAIEAAKAKGKAPPKAPEGLALEGRSFRATESTRAQTQKVTKLEPVEAKHYVYNPDLPRPDIGFRADYMRANPEWAEAARASFGPEFLPSTMELEARGSFSMASRMRHLKDLKAFKGEDDLARRYDDFAIRSAKIIMQNPEFRAKIPGGAGKLVAEAAEGKLTERSLSAVQEASSQIMSARSTTPRLQAASRALEEADIRWTERLGQARTGPELRALREAKGAAKAARSAPADLRAAQTAEEGARATASAARRARETSPMAARLRELGEEILGSAARLARAQAEYARMRPTAPHADLASSSFGGRLLPPALHLVADPVGRAGQRVLSGAGRGLDALGALIARDPGHVLPAVLANSGIRPRTRALAERIARAAPGARTALVQALLRDPAVREAIGAQ